MGDAGIKAHSGHDHTIFGDEAFAYDRVANIYRCPAGQEGKKGKEGVKSKHLTLAIGSAMRKQWRGLCA
jgi:hypothetical protein